MQLVNWLTNTFLHHSQFAGYLEPVMQRFKPAWRSNAFRAKVASVIVMREDVVALTLSIPSRWPIHEAGQHIALTLEIDGRLMTRTFTIASSPREARRAQSIRLVIKQTSLGQFTPHVSNLTVDEWVNISAPMGDFTSQVNKNDVLMLAAGSGITPFIAMLQALPSASNQPITLLYYAKPGAHLLIDELTQLADKHPKVTVKLMTRAEHGDVSSHLSHYANARWLVCGPNPFYQQICQNAERLNVEVDSEHFLAAPVVQDSIEALDITYDNRQHTVSNDDTLLSQLIKAGENVTFGCGIGVCHQCKCTKKSGVVRNIKTGQLSDAGHALIQLCISQPVTPLELEI